MKYTYTSEKVMAYVYWLTHKFTNEYYIGYHMSNVDRNIPSHLDIGTVYFTSSTLIERMGFENFDWVIIAEFFTGLDAYNFEQSLIREHIGHPGCLNRRVGDRWNTIGSSPWENKNEEEKFQYSKNLSDAHFRVPEEERKERYRKRSLKNYLKSEEQKKETGRRQSEGTSKGHANRSIEEKLETKEKHKIYFENRTEEETAEIIRKRLITESLRTDEEKLIISEKKSNSMNSRSEEDKKEHGRKISLKKKGVPFVKVQCPHCGVWQGKNLISRYHFDSCKKLRQ